MGSIGHANAGTINGTLGRYDYATAEFKKALQLDPQDAYVHERYGAVLLWQGKNNEAIAEFEKAASFSNRQPEKLAWLGYAYAVSGEKDRALELLDEIKRNPRGQYVSPFYAAMLYTGLGDKQNAFTSLEKACADHDEWMVYLRVYPEFASLRGDSHFQDLERRVGLL
jgi:tetratricopeptide (TPR) repeat protein